MASFFSVFRHFYFPLSGRPSVLAFPGILLYYVTMGLVKIGI